MTVRDTSIAVYRQIEAEGLLSRLRWRVYSWLFHNGPASSFEIAEGISAEHKSVSPRMTELVDRGVVQEVGKKTCTASPQRHTVIAWDVTSNLPQEPRGASVREIKLTLIFTDDIDPSFDEDRLVQLAGDDLLDYDIDIRRRKARDREALLLLRREQDGRSTD